MGSASVVIPEILETVPDDGIAVVERWAALRRAELSRRALELPTIVRRAEQLESELSRPFAELPSVLESVDADLEAATVAAVTTVAKAESDAAGIVARAATFAANVVRLAGLDPTTVEGLSPKIPPQTPPTHPFEFRTRSAHELWSVVVGTAGAPSTGERFFGADSDDLMARDPDRDFWSEVSADRSAFGRLRRRVSEQRQ